MQDKFVSNQPTSLAPKSAIQFKWRLFSFLERLTAGPAAAPNLPPESTVKPALWVFASTIGELNAIAPFLRQLVDLHRHLQLVLLTDRRIYRDAFLAQYPAAEVIEIGASSAPAVQLAAQRPPQLFIVAEIPCLPNDAPCRLPFGYPYQAHQAGAVVALVNGWLYGYPPSCRMDKIERQLLGASYLQIFDVMCVQTDEVAQQLIALGADTQRVRITGNIKFDALQTSVRRWQDTSSPHILRSLEASERPIVVAGCVTDDDERELVMDAFVGLRKQQPHALLVLAPRHPENQAVMRAIHTDLGARQLSYRCRSSDGDAAIADDLAVLVLDTMGELRDYYARAKVAHVGRDHNVLEPLAFGKPVTVRPNWDKTFPSYPVFSMADKDGLLSVQHSSAGLRDEWLSKTQANQSQASKALNAMQQLAGASARSLACLERLEAIRGAPQ